MKLAILLGAGQLPVMIKQAHPDAHVVGFEGMPTELVNIAHLHRFERLGALFSDLRDRGVSHIVMAGAMSRPDFAPDLLDEFTKSALPALMEAMAHGDDHLLRYLIVLIEGQGFSVIGAHSLLPLTQPAGVLAGQVPADVERDIARADQVLKTLSPLDVGQGVVVENGLVQAPRGELDGLNLVGLKRRGVAREDITALRAAFQMLAQGEGTFKDRATRLSEETDSDYVRTIVDFVLAESDRSFLTPS